MRSGHSTFIVIIFACCSFAGPVLAQTTQGALVGGVVSAFATDSQTAISVSFAGSYRFSRVFGLGLELTMAPSIESRRDRISLPGLPSFPSLSSLVPFPSRSTSFDFEPSDGQITAFTTNVRLEVPTTSSRFIPYATAGGGVANVKESVDAIIALSFDALTIPELSLPAIYPPIPYSYRVSTTHLALTLGGGVSVLAGEHLALDVDLRYLRLVGTRDRNIGRFGGGASYRF